MNNYEKIRNIRVHETVSIAKLLTILFSGIILFSVYGEKFGQILTTKNNTIPVMLCCIAIIVLALIYQVWIFSNKSKNMPGLNIGTIIEMAAFIGVLFGLILISGAYSSPYKIVFLLIIAASTIQFGKKTGICIAVICGGLLLTMDLVLIPRSINNKYFEADILLFGVFVLTSWLLGGYAEIEERYQAQIIDMANKDDLTNVYNHRFFQQSMVNEIQRATRLNQPVSLLFLDIDYFKNYNDLYGHMKGDILLKQFADIIAAQVRSGDIVARYGGDEFAIILPNTSEEEGIRIGERIRKEIDSKHFDGEENLPKKHITVSVGVSCFPHIAKTKGDLINSADDALYRAKFFNKNRVEVYSSILEELKEDIQEEHIDTISSMKTLISIINAKDRYTYGHTERVVVYSNLLAQRLNLPEAERKILKYGAYLHDIGKIEIPQEVLNKKMKLSEKEWEYIRKHPVDGAEIIKPVSALADVIPLILHHHERYDGGGYPSKLKGEEIPKLVKILSIADSFDAMTSNRPYRPRMSYEEAILELERCKFTQFDPELVDVFISAVEDHVGDGDTGTGPLSHHIMEKVLI